MIGSITTTLAGARLDGAHRQLELALGDDLDLASIVSVRSWPCALCAIDQLLGEHHAAARIEDRRHLVGGAAQARLERALEALDARGRGRR